MQNINKIIKILALLLVIAAAFVSFGTEALAADDNYSQEEVLEILMHDKSNPDNKSYYAEYGEIHAEVVSPEGIGHSFGGGMGIIKFERIDSGRYRFWKSDDGYTYEYYDAIIEDGKPVRLDRIFNFGRGGEEKESEYPAYRVWFNNWGGWASEESPQQVYVKPGSKVSKFPAPQKDGYTFAGWCTDLDRTAPYDFNSPVNADIELFALWKFPVTFDLGFLPPAKKGEAPVPLGKYTEVQVYEGKPIAEMPADPVQYGYTFLGWFEDEACTVPFYPENALDGSMTLYAKWSATVVTVSYDMHGHGQQIPTKKYDFNQNPDWPGIPEDKSYVFDNWYYDESFTRTVDFAVPLQESVTFHAHWIEGVTVTYDTGWRDVDPSPAAVKWNASVPRPQNPTYEYDTFEGWYLDQACTQPVDFSSLKALKAMTLYAKWREGCHVVFYTEIGTAPEDYYTFSNKTITKPEDPTDPDYYKEFYGWYTDPGFTKAWNFSKDLAPAGDVLQLYAKWGQPYIIYFDAMSGEGGGFLRDCKPGKVISGTIPYIKETLDDGRVFAGWYSDKNCTQFFDVNNDPLPADSESFILYALYTESCTVTVHPGDGESYDITVAKDVPVGAAALREYTKNISKPGETTYGWYKDADFTQPWDPGKDPAYNGLQLYVDWGLSKATITGILDNQYFVSENDAYKGFHMGNSYFFKLGDSPADKITVIEKIGGETYRLRTNEDKNATEEDPYYDLTLDGRNAVNIVLDNGSSREVYTPCLYVEYSLIGGWISSGHTYELLQAGDTVDPDFKPYKTDGIFDCWCYDLYGLEPYDMSTPVTENLRLYARYTGTVTVTLMSERGGFTPYPVRICSGNTIKEPSLTDKSSLRDNNRGYEVEGWYIGGGNQRWDFNDPVYADMMLSARWKETEFTLTFEMNGHGTAPADQTFTVRRLPEKPKDPFESGWTFRGWFTDAKCTRPADFTMHYSENITFYAGWSEVTLGRSIPPKAEMGLTENGLVQNLITPGTSGNGRFEYRLGNNSTDAPESGWDTEVPSASNAGTYYVWFRFIPNVRVDEPEAACLEVTIAAVPVYYDDDEDEEEEIVSEPAGEKISCERDPSCALNSFSDLDVNAWYHDGIHYCLENGIMSGYPGDLFKPDGTASRAQIAAILWNMNGNPYADYAMSFPDVSEAMWYTEAIRWAAAEKIVSGYSDGTFGPNDPITREQLAVILYNYAKSKGIDVSVDENTNFLNYNDFRDVSEWAKPAMMWAVERELIVGNNMDLMPQNDAVRAQAATIIFKFCETISSNI